MDALSGHVEFLTQPALKGRFAGSWESAHVRRYLSDHLKQYGCVPWADNPSYELDFGFGKNIIAVLPGSDPQLSKEIVLISAHYDHLKPSWFKYYPGACDNAAAVAVLLELTKNISRMEPRPKRSICIAFFDAEEQMCLGSFAFTCRDDYDDSKIVSVINMDLLGRDLLDVVENSFVVSGAEYYHDLYNHINAACSRHNLKFMPLAADLIGPGSDHIAFISSHRPVLFFTAGTYKDYHQPSDTAGKLNYPQLTNQQAVIENTLLALANNQELFVRRLVPANADSFVYLLEQIKAHDVFFKLEPNDIKSLDEQITASAKIDPNTMTSAQCLAIERESLSKVIKLLKNYDKTLAQQGDLLLQLSSLFAIHPEAIADTYRQTVRYYLNHKPSFFKKNAFAYQKNLPLTGSDWGLVKTGEHEFLFGAVNEEVALQNEIHLLSGFNVAFVFKHKLTACKGSLPQIIDFIFAGKDPNGLVKESCKEAFMIGFSDQMRDGLTKDQLIQRKKDLWSEFRTTLEHQFPDEIASANLESFDEPAFLSDPNSAASESVFITSFVPDTVQNLSKKNLIDYSIKMLQDPSSDIQDRVNALTVLSHIPNRSGLMTMAGMIDETTLYTVKPRLIEDPNFPLREHPFVSDYLLRTQKQRDEWKDKTLGQIATENLKRATQKDFSTDKDAWKKYIQKHYTDLT